MKSRKNENGLTELQQEFADAYLLLPREDRSGTAAYKAIRPKATQRGAESQGNRLLSISEVKAYIADREKDVVAEIREKQLITEEEVITELAHMGLARLTDVISWDEEGNVRYIASHELDDRGKAAVKGLKMTIVEHENRQGEVRTTKRMEILMHDKAKPLEMLGKYRELGLFRDTVEVTGKNGGPVQIVDPQERINRIAFLLNRGRDQGA